MTRKIIALLLVMALFSLPPAAAFAEEPVPSMLDIACEPTDILALDDGSFLITDAYYKVVLLLRDGQTGLYAGAPTRAGLRGEPAGGYRDGSSESSTFRRPWAIAPFGAGYAVSDTANDCVRYVTGETTETITIGGAGQQTAWSSPTGLAADDNGDLYVADTGSGRVCRIDHRNGAVTVLCAGLNEPTGMCWSNGSLYIAETAGNRILKWDGTTGALTVLAGNGEAACIDGPAEEAAFCRPLGVEAAEDGTVFIADTGSCAVRMLRDGVVTTLLAADTEALDQYPSQPQGMACVGGVLYVCDPYANKIYTIEVTEEQG